MSKKVTQYDRIAKLITRKNGATAWVLMAEAGSTSIHRRMFEMKQRGWTITRKEIPGCTHGRYFGKAPK